MSKQIQSSYTIIEVSTPVFVQKQGESIFTFAYVFEINKQTISFVDSDWNFFELPRRYAEQNTLTVEQFAMQVYLAA